MITIYRSGQEYMYCRNKTCVRRCKFPQAFSFRFA
uniref:Uncharacterized protein n=1 Tax=Zea mays TaxID=4577 RepID=B6SSD6_MAIZE|nr:hypothetical protein [Zea mays]